MGKFLYKIETKRDKTDLVFIFSIKSEQVQ